jgi:hypothetical protein
MMGWFPLVETSKIHKTIVTAQPLFIMAIQENRPSVAQVLQFLREVGSVDFYIKCVI